jgi:SAM-dependent methyltransferase
MGKNKNKNKRKNDGETIATTADRYELYQLSVQSPDVDVEFLERAFKKNFRRQPMTLREDFCGTAAISCSWVESKRGRVALGVDLDPEPLAWGREHNVGALPENKRDRVRLIEDDVRIVHDDKVDVVCAHNFSFCVFKTRDELREYFSAARANLANEGVLVLDVVGGAELQEEDREETRKIGKGVRYVWHQRRFDPISHRCEFSIHFLFKDGSAMLDAFRYEWRLWTIPEIRELLDEAGFSRSDVYWEGTDEKTGEGNGKYKKQDTAEADPAWVACIVAVK